MELHISIKANYIVLPAAILAGLVLAVGAASMAKDSELDTGPRAIPYDGVLEFDGARFNGQVDLQFTLTDDPSGANVNCFLDEEHDNVTVYAGRFSVNIGQPTGALDDCFFDSAAVYVQVGVRSAASGGSYTTLNGAQRIHPVPFSTWSAEGSDFKVDGDLKLTGAISTPDSTLTIDDSLQVNDDLNATGNVAIDGNLSMSDTVFLSRGNAANNGLTWPDNAFGGSGDDAWIRYDQDGANGDAALQVGIGNDASDDIEFHQGGSIRMHIDNNVHINTNLDMHGSLTGSSGPLTVDDGLTITGTTNAQTIRVQGELSFKPNTTSGFTLPIFANTVSPFQCNSSNEGIVLIGNLDYDRLLVCTRRNNSYVWRIFN